MSPDPKPVTEGGIGRKKPAKGKRARGRVMATRLQWEGLRAEKLTGRCRCCSGVVGHPPTELHHLVPRSRGGDDVADNLVPLCISCHTFVTGNAPTFIGMLSANLTDGEYAYITGKLGEGGPGRLFGV